MAKLLEGEEQPNFPLVCISHAVTAPVNGSKHQKYRSSSRALHTHTPEWKLPAAHVHLIGHREWICRGCHHSGQPETPSHSQLTHKQLLWFHHPKTTLAKWVSDIEDVNYGSIIAINIFQMETLPNRDKKQALLKHQVEYLIRFFVFVCIKISRISKLIFHTTPFFPNNTSEIFGNFNTT